MKTRFLAVMALCIAAAAFAVAQDPGAMPPGAPGGQGPGARGGGRGWGGGGMMGRGLMGTVTEVAADHFTVKNEAGETWTVHYSVNTRVMKMAAETAGAAAGGAGRAEGGQRGMGFGGNPPTPIKATDIKVGDAIGAMGEVDAAGKSVGAVMIMQMDPQAAKRMAEMRANFGKTWLQGRVTAINETTVTLESPVDNAAHTFVADENTAFRRRREPITLADIQVGDNVRVEGAVKEGQFVAATVGVMMPPASGGPAPRPGPPPR
jgi:hypothetical protein